MADLKENNKATYINSDDSYHDNVVKEIAVELNNVVLLYFIFELHNLLISKQIKTNYMTDLYN